MHYLDYAATTPVSPAVAEAMTTALTNGFANPSSQYAPGRAARAALEQNRAIIADALGCAPSNLFFTSGGTESDNWAIRAALHQNRRVGKHIITTAVEHSAVLQVMKALEQDGYSVTYLTPDSKGHITIEQVAAALQDDTALISIMLVNNELGTLYPVDKVASLLRIKNHPALLHTDAVQAFLEIPFTVKTLGADFVSISAHKIGGPKGIGALFIGNRAKNPLPLLYGGGQESGYRAGTEPTAQIAGFAKAVSLWQEKREEIVAHIKEIHAYALDRLSSIPTLELVGESSAPHILSVSLPGYPSQNIISELDARGICASAGSACHKGKASHVLTAMGLDKRVAAGTIRISFGAETERADIDALYVSLLLHKTTRYPML